MSMIGKTLGTFTLEAQIGKGGMGEVYKAKDQKLGRDVAIKVLPEEFAKDADRVARFQREAKLLASLNHPNIAAIHGLEEAGGTHFLVLELIEGDTLADRLKRGAIPVEESLKLAMQIAEALEAAHEKGVIHRDLKPANIKVTPDGKVKVLDFGLAKVFAGDQEDINLSNSPTLSAAATQQGIILGTAAYMSPEQARGKPVDKRTDIWAFGVVLYEMLTGQSAFQGEDVSVTLASVIKGDTNLTLLPASIHPRVREVITRCLQNEQKKRYADISDVQYEIGQVLSDPSGLFLRPIAMAEPRARPRAILVWVGSLILAAVVAGAVIWNLRTPMLPLITRFSYQLPDDLKFGEMSECAIAISPDGRQLVFATSEGLYRRFINELDAELVPGTNEAPENLFFSPNNRWIGYWSRAESQLNKIPINGGVSVTVSSQGSVGSFHWATDDSIVYARGRNIMRVSADGGDPELLAESATGSMIVAPQILPDGKSVMYTQGPQPWKVVIQSLGSGEYTELFEGDTARYLSTGHIVYGANNNLYAVPFDLNELELLGEPQLMVEGIYRENALQYSISESGTLVYIPEMSRLNPQYALVWVNRDGKEEPIKADPHNYSGPRISPHGDKLAVAIGSSGSGIGDADIWIWDFIRKNLNPFSRKESQDMNPLWTPDSQRIVFESALKGEFVIYSQDAESTADPELICSARDKIMLPASFTPDGNTLVVMEVTLGPLQSDIAMVSMDGDGEIKPLLNEKYHEACPQLSPTGKWLAYSSNASGKYEIYVRPFPDVERIVWTVSINGGTEPIWSPDSRKLFYRNGDEVMGVDVVELEEEPILSFGNPEVLFRRNYVSSGDIDYATINTWDIHPYDNQFLMIKPVVGTEEESATVGPNKIVVVTNWFEELKERVPLK